MHLSEFLRLYPMRTPGVMWFLGAGASAAAGVRTAYHMIWEFKREIYCSTQRVPLAACSDLSNPLVRSRIQACFDSPHDAPKENATEEYSYFFDKAYPHESDRRRYIERAVTGASPSFGHIGLAALLKMKKVRIVWTTNFDRVVEDAVSRVFGNSSEMVVATIETRMHASEAISESRWPLLVKLHGDFHSRRLKNTSAELQKQDEEMRACLLTACRTNGLAVVGYSGRDDSIMDTLDETLADGRGFPSGLFWFHRSESACLPRVQRLIEQASSKGIDAHLIEVDTFDELMSDVLSLMPDVQPELTKMLEERPKRILDAPLPGPEGAWPILRLNAFPILSAPSVCRKVVCEIQGHKEVQQAVTDAHTDIIVGRRNVGVIAFGGDSEIRKTFERFAISEFSVHSIEHRRLRYDSAELGLLYEALCRAIARERPVLVRRRGRRAMVIVDSSRVADPSYDALRSALSKVVGTVSKSGIAWSEAARIRLEYRIDRLWLLIEPTIAIDEAVARPLPDDVKEFVRERLALRYNATWNQILDGWADVLIGRANSGEIRAFGRGDGLDAVFSISRTTAFSWRGGIR